MRPPGIPPLAAPASGRSLVLAVSEDSSLPRGTAAASRGPLKAPGQGCCRFAGVVVALLLCMQRGGLERTGGGRKGGNSLGVRARPHPGPRLPSQGIKPAGSGRAGRCWRPSLPGAGEGSPAAVAAAGPHTPNEPSATNPPPLTPTPTPPPTSSPADPIPAPPTPTPRQGAGSRLLRRRGEGGGGLAVSDPRRPGVVPFQHRPPHLGLPSTTPHTQTRTRTHARTHAFTHAFTHAHAPRTHTHTHTHMHAHSHARA